MAHILIVEDEKPIRELLRLNMLEAGYECTCAADGLQATELLENHTYDLAILDIMLPYVNGYELLEYTKPSGTPVIFLTAKAAIDDRVKGLTAGAEDYIVKPFAIAELLARIEVILRRYHKSAEILKYDEWSIDTESRTVTSADETVHLTPKEYELFVLFVRNRGVALFRNRIFQMIWETDYVEDTRTLDLHIQRLRKKLHLEERLKTIYRIGYRLE